MSRSTKLMTLSTAALAPWLLMSAVAAPDTDNFTPTAAVTIGNLEGVVQQSP